VWCWCWCWHWRSSRSRSRRCQECSNCPPRVRYHSNPNPAWKETCCLTHRSRRHGSRPEQCVHSSRRGCHLPNSHCRLGRTDHCLRQWPLKQLPGSCRRRLHLTKKQNGRPCRLERRPQGGRGGCVLLGEEEQSGAIPRVSAAATADEAIGTSMSVSVRRRRRRRMRYEGASGAGAADTSRSQLRKG